MASALVSNKRARLLTAAAAPLAIDAANDGVLPSELLHDVLLRLPADTLCRLRLVCRSWRSLTSDPVFADAHAARHCRPLVAGVHVPSGEIRFMDLSGDVVKRIRVEEEDCRHLYLSSQLDTVCISTSTSGKETFARVLNTATGASTVLPGDIIPACHDSVDHLAACMFVLGHVPSTEELKVLRIHLRVGLRDNRASGVYLNLTCDTMTLGNNGGDGGRWRVKPQPPFNVWSVDGNNAAVIDGIAYFMIRRDIDFIGYSAYTMPGTIASFDLAAEEWGSAMIQGPQSIHLHCTYRDKFRLAALDGCLVTVFYKSQDFDCSMDLWFLEDVDSCIWTKRYSIRFTPYFSVKDKFTSWYPLMVLDDRRIVVWDGESSSLKAYDTGTRTWEHLTSIKDFLYVHKHEGNFLTSRSSEVGPA